MVPPTPGDAILPTAFPPPSTRPVPPGAQVTAPRHCLPTEQSALPTTESPLNSNSHFILSSPPPGHPVCHDAIEKARGLCLTAWIRKTSSRSRYSTGNRLFHRPFHVPRGDNFYLNTTKPYIHPSILFPFCILFCFPTPALGYCATMALNFALGARSQNPAQCPADPGFCAKRWPFLLTCRR